MHEIERHPAEQPFVNPRMSKGAGYDEIGVLRVEVGEQRLNRGQLFVGSKRALVHGPAVANLLFSEHAGDQDHAKRSPDRELRADRQIEAPPIEAPARWTTASTPARRSRSG